ncbi:MAG TPA: thiolase family protein [Candidatus Nanoarchaeia archaeon]|nr:thiolase family protein [Candidatus Nanoarchaeia archaeon]
MNPVYIAGTGMVPFSKTPQALDSLLYNAAKLALDQSRSIANNVPDAVVIGVMDPIGYSGTGVSAAALRGRLGLPPNTAAYPISLGSASGSEALLLAHNLCQLGKTVLVCFGESVNLAQSPNRSGDILSSVIDAEERAIGLFNMPTVAALATNRYQRMYKVTDQSFREIAFSMTEASRKYGSKNPYVPDKFKVPVSQQEYDDPSKNRIIASPLSFYDCSTSDHSGAGAVVFTPKKTDLKLASIATAFDHDKYLQRRDLLAIDSVVNAGAQAFREAGINPHDIMALEIHDAFKSVPIVLLENLGIAMRGKGAEAILYERNARGKPILFNRSGGFLARTHPVGASGGAQLVELVCQMRGERQYDLMLWESQRDMNYGLLCNINSFGTDTIVAIVEKTAPHAKPRFNEAHLPKKFDENAQGQGYHKRIQQRAAKMIGNNPIHALTHIPANPRKDGDTDTYIAIVDTPKGKRIGVSKNEFADYIYFDEYNNPESVKLGEIGRRMALQVVDSVRSRLGIAGTKEAA